MARWADMNGAARGGVGAAVAVVVAMTVWVAVQGRGPKPPPVEPAAMASEVEPVAEAAIDPAAAPAPEPAVTATEADAPAASEAPVLALLAPTIDVLRVAPDGMTTLAGRTEALASVSVLVDGTEVAMVGANGSGQFATVFTIPPSDAARMMTLVATLADGRSLAGVEGVAIAPVILPLPEAQIANAETAAEPAADPAADAVVAPEAEAIAEPTIEPTASAAIKVTEAGAEVVQTAKPVPAEIAAEVSLDVIAYGAEGAVQLGGTGAAGAGLRLYLDNVETAATAVAEDGKWSVTSASIAPGVYTLRIDQVDAAGKVTSRLETPFKRETLEALAEAAAPVESADTVVATEETAAEPAVAEEKATETAQVAAPGAEPAAEAPATGTDAAPEPAAAEQTSLAAKPSATTAPAADPAPEASAAPITVTVQPGFTLWAIAKQNFGSGVMYVQVFEANKDKIKNPDLIYPGQVLSVPASP